MIDGGRLVLQLLQNIQKDLIGDINAKGISQGDLGIVPLLKITGEVIVGELHANHYWYYLVHGRAPGKMPPIESILGWLIKKGIQAADNISQNSLAYLIARKIGRVGTDIFLGRRPGMAFDQIVAEHQAEFEETYFTQMGEDIQRLLFAKFQLKTT